MQAIRIRKRDGDIYVLNHFPQKITNQGKSLTYWIYGKGYKKTASFEILPEELPDKWGQPWLDIMYIHEKYGINVSEVYADGRVAGIVARQNVLSRYALFRKASHLLNPETDREFFELIRPEYLSSCVGLYMIDIVATDKQFSKADPEYDFENVTYRGESCSQEEYVRRKFGDRYVAIINAMI